MRLILILFLSTSLYAQSQCDFIRGDLDYDGDVDMTDWSLLYSIIDSQGDPGDVGDIDDNGTTNPDDAIALLNWFMSGGNPPAEPFWGGLGFDWTPDYIDNECSPAPEDVGSSANSDTPTADYFYGLGCDLGGDWKDSDYVWVQDPDPIHIEAGFKPKKHCVEDDECHVIGMSWGATNLREGGLARGQWLKETECVVTFQVDWLLWVYPKIPLIPPFTLPTGPCDPFNCVDQGRLDIHRLDWLLDAVKMHARRDGVGDVFVGLPVKWEHSWAPGVERTVFNEVNFWDHWSTIDGDCNPYSMTHGLGNHGDTWPEYVEVKVTFQFDGNNFLNSNNQPIGDASNFKLEGFFAPEFRGSFDTDEYSEVYSDDAIPLDVTWISMEFQEK